MMRTPGADSRMFQTPGRPDSAAYPGSTQISKRPGSVTFQFPESTGRTFRQGMGTNVSLSTWGSDFSPVGYTPHGATAHGPTPAQVSSGRGSIRCRKFFDKYISRKRRAFSQPLTTMRKLWCLVFFKLRSIFILVINSQRHALLLKRPSSRVIVNKTKLLSLIFRAVIKILSCCFLKESVGHWSPKSSYICYVSYTCYVSNLE